MWSEVVTICDQLKMLASDGNFNDGESATIKSQTWF